jgi:putative transposase
VAIKHVYENSFDLYGARKVWYEMRREEINVAKWTVERLMRAMAGFCRMSWSTPSMPADQVPGTA